jgi:hemerythrin-like domain-containing protein
MNMPQTDAVISSESLDQHEHIHFFLDRCAETVAELGVENVDTELLRRLAAVIASLKEHLTEHIRIEESMIFQAIVDRLPEVEDEILSLSEQHPGILEILEMARIHALNGEPEDAAALQADLEGYLDMIRDHEKAEGDLLRRALKHENRGITD